MNLHPKAPAHSRGFTLIELPTEHYGFKVDWPKLDTGFANSDPDVQSGAYLGERHRHYSPFPQALVGLGKLSRNPALTEA